jgi:transcriptional regulator with XRE-family HTH domain
MKQCEIAKELGISKSYLSMILSGQRKVKPELAAKLSSQKVVNFEAKNCFTRKRSLVQIQYRPPYHRFQLKGYYRGTTRGSAVSVRKKAVATEARNQLTG